MASEPDPSEPSGPIRTCIGCRRRAAAAVLLRVVVASDAIGKATERDLTVRPPGEQPGGGSGALPVVPDPRGRIPGRGAWLHPDPGCVALAQRRRAFVRALRVSGSVDLTSVDEYVTAEYGNDTTSGTPQEMKSYGHSMKRQQ